MKQIKLPLELEPTDLEVRKEKAKLVLQELREAGFKASMRVRKSARDGVRIYFKAESLEVGKTYHEIVSIVRRHFKKAYMTSGGGGFTMRANATVVDQGDMSDRTLSVVYGG